MASESTRNDYQLAQPQFIARNMGKADLISCNIQNTSSFAWQNSYRRESIDACLPKLENGCDKDKVISEYFKLRDSNSMRPALSAYVAEGASRSSQFRVKEVAAWISKSRKIQYKSRHYGFYSASSGNSSRSHCSWHFLWPFWKSTNNARLKRYIKIQGTSSIIGPLGPLVAKVS